MFTVRPHPSPNTSDLKTSYRIHLSATACLTQGFEAGDACFLSKDGVRAGACIAWPAKDKIQDHLVQTTRALQRAYGLSLGDKITISKSGHSIVPIETLYLQEVFQENRTAGHMPESDRYPWEWMLKNRLGRVELFAKNMLFENIEINEETRDFLVYQINDGNDAQPLGNLCSASKVKIVPPGSKSTRSRVVPLQLPLASIGGLAPQIEKLNKRLRACSDQLDVDRPFGIILQGPRGTGKTMILEKIAATGWGRVYRVDFLRGARGIREIFAEAKSQLRSIIIVDQLERLDHKRGGNLDVTSALSDEMVKLDNEPQTPQIIIIGATNAIGDLDENLRSPGPFVFEIDIPIPDIRARNEILRCLRRTPADMGDPILEALGERTHGYTGADLRALLRTARSEAAHRRRPAAVAEGEDVLEEVDEAADSKEEQNGAAGHGLLEEDLDKALLCIRPSAMRELVLEVPKVRWSDIGGQEKVKKSLREAVEWPLKYPERMKRIGTVPKKGLLLYGPPGCSKTLTAKALATEAGFNFIAVKGPELQSMWVGETERALRNVFAKARAASPSIIFFDEVDSIGAKRRNVKNNSLSMLETLLNEMDGIETLKGVFVLAATNKPDSLDLALLRPGRLDSMLYVAPPDLSARRDILRTHLSRMDVADTVDVEGLAARTEGHSGAEIVEICQKAGYMALGDSIDANTELQIGKEHFEQALAQVPRQITEERRTWYEEWTVEGVKKM